MDWPSIKMVIGKIGMVGTRICNCGPILAEERGSWGRRMYVPGSIPLLQEVRLKSRMDIVLDCCQDRWLDGSIARVPLPW